MKSHYFGDPAALVREHRTTPDGQAYLSIWMRNPFAVDGVIYTPPAALNRWQRRGGEGPMIGVRPDRPSGGVSGGWRWRPATCPTALALTEIKPGEYL